ncbi:MAG: thiamine pyrophosphate-requiring protein [Proteobacteria bacterium]|nr:thiamine pyrophosphate-requiring protein [Pseudomonadota bacterium]
MYTASTAFLEALTEAGVSCLFVNLGSDHPALVEAMAEARATGRPIPRVITCPNEMVALSAAHGHAQASGQAQAVLVHVECGTQALAGAVHNAAKGRIPVLIFAGMSPFTQEGELRGSRNEFIQWIQDVADQPGIVRGYVKYSNELRTGRNVKQIVHRAMQFAHSDPKGPVYLMGAREVMEEETAPVAIDRAAWQPIAPAGLPPEGCAALAEALLTAERPLVVTSYLGRNPAAAEALTALCRRLGVGVLESVPNYVNFPADDPLYQGNQWNQPQQNPALDAADLVLVIDSDVPWIPTVSRPRAGARIFHIDVDPLKQQMPLWYIPAQQVFRADAATALRQVAAALEGRAPSPALLEARRAHHAALHAARAARLEEREAEPVGAITPEYLTACLRAHIDERTIVVNESISNYQATIDHLRLTKPGQMFVSGGGSLGYHGGAAIGVKLARPDATVIAVAGDGSYMFSVPSSVHWIARQYETPFLTVIYNNRGWKSPKLSALAVHPSGHASRANALDVEFDPPPDYAAIAAAAGGAWARSVKLPQEVAPALEEALHAVRAERRCAVLDVWLPHL